MGLDTVELLMRVEAELGIEIPDRDADKVQTVGGMHDSVFAKLCEREGRDNIVEAAVWSKLVDAIVEQFGVDPTEVQREALFIEGLRMD